MRSAHYEASLQEKDLFPDIDIETVVNALEPSLLSLPNVNWTSIGRHYPHRDRRIE